MWHSVFIVLHASAAVVAFGAGCLALRRARLYAAYLWSLLGMAVFLVLAVGAGWARYDVVTRIIFSALGVLAGFMVWRGIMAGRVRPTGLGRPSAPYVEHVGFTLVGLADGFLVVTVLRMGAPGWFLAATGVGVAVVGHLVLGAARDRLVAIPVA